jgi:hypothetical protein
MTRTLVDLPSTHRVLEARIAPRAGADALASDDRAFATLSPRARTRVLLVTEGNRYLEAALLLDEYLDVEEVAPARYTDARGFDVVVFDRASPPQDPGVPALYLGPGAGYFPLELAESVPRPYFDRVEEHPVTRKLALKDVNIARATRARPAAGDHVIASTQRGAPLWVEGRRQAPFMALTFDVRESDLPLRAAWPLLLLRSLEQLSGRHTDTPLPYTAGELVEVALDDPHDATLRAPGGEVVPARIIDGSVRFVPARAGVYELERRGEPLALAVHLPASESEIAPRLILADIAQPADTDPFQSSWLDERVWPLLVALALSLLLVEWLTFHRRWTV